MGRDAAAAQAITGWQRQCCLPEQDADDALRLPACRAMAASTINSTAAGSRPAGPMPAPAGATAADQVAAATEAIRSNPAMLKDAARMLDSLPPEQLEAMMGSVPGAPPGFKARHHPTAGGRGDDDSAALSRGCAARLHLLSLANLPPSRFHAAQSQMDVGQLKAAAKLMESLSPEGERGQGELGAGPLEQALIHD